MTGTKPLIDVKTLRFTLIETADECRELGMQHPADDHLRGAEGAGGPAPTPLHAVAADLEAARRLLQDFAIERGAP